MRTRLKEGAQVSVGLPLDALLVRIQSSVKQWSESGSVLGGAEPANLGFLKNVIATEHFVRAFAGEHDFVVMVADELGKDEKGRGCGSKDWYCRVPDDVGEHASNAVVSTMHLVMVGPDE